MGDRGLPLGLLPARAGVLAASERVVRVPPQRMGASRKGEREPGKSDEIDALAVARAVVKDGVGQFPVAFLDKGAMEIRLLLDHRHDLVVERTRTINRLRWHLLELCPELERQLGRGALNKGRVLDRVATVGCASFSLACACGSPASSSLRSVASTTASISSAQSWQSWSPRTAPSC